MNIADLQNLYWVIVDRVLFKPKKSMLEEQLLSPKKYFDYELNQALENHLYYIHGSRLKFISLVIPEAKNIVDLGGANGSLYEMCYPYKFDMITDWLGTGRTMRNVL